MCLNNDDNPYTQFCSFFFPRIPGISGDEGVEYVSCYINKSDANARVHVKAKVSRGPFPPCCTES